MSTQEDQFKDQLDVIIDSSADATDTKLASKITSLTTKSEAEINELFPESADVKKLLALMEIVKSSESRNDKINKIVANAQEFGGVVLTLLGKFA